MVASSANISRPRAPPACGVIALALATKAAMSADVDAVSGNDPAFPAVGDLLSFAIVDSRCCSGLTGDHPAAVKFGGEPVKERPSPGGLSGRRQPLMNASRSAL